MHCNIGWGLGAPNGVLTTTAFSAEDAELNRGVVNSCQPLCTIAAFVWRAQCSVGPTVQHSCRVVLLLIQCSVSVG